MYVKLTKNDVLGIRAVYPYITTAKIAELYDVSISTIYAVAGNKGKMWHDPDYDGKKKKMPFASATGSNRKFDEKDIVEIQKRYAKGETEAELAGEYGVCQSTISFALNGHTYRNVLPKHRKRRNKPKTGQGGAASR